MLRKTINRLKFNLLSRVGIGLPHGFTDDILMAAGVKPVSILRTCDVGSEMQDAIKDGRIVLIEEFVFPHLKYPIQVHAQKDKIEDGKELVVRYYKDDEGYPKLSKNDGVSRVGELLGYTKEDTKFFLSKGIYGVPLVKPLIFAFQNSIREVRYKNMMRDAQTPAVPLYEYAKSGERYNSEIG